MDSQTPGADDKHSGGGGGGGGLASWLKPSLDWLLIFVPIAIALRFIPALENPTALFIISCLAIIPLAGWMGKATEHLAERLGGGICLSPSPSS